MGTGSRPEGEGACSQAAQTWVCGDGAAPGSAVSLMSTLRHPWPASEVLPVSRASIFLSLPRWALATGLGGGSACGGSAQGSGVAASLTVCQSSFSLGPHGRSGDPEPGRQAPRCASSEINLRAGGLCSQGPEPASGSGWC